MPLSVNINYISPEQSYLIDDLAKYTEHLCNLEGKSISQICDIINHLNNDSEDVKNLKNLLNEMVSKGLGSLKIWHAEHDHLTGFDAFMFTDDYGNTGFSFGPTEIHLDNGDVMDVRADLDIAVFGHSAQYKRAKEFFEKYKDGSGNNFLFGYSLGGNLALFIYREYSNLITKVSVFNALPIKDWTMTDEDKIKIQQWVKDGDNVHKIGIIRADHSNEDYFTGSQIEWDSGPFPVGDHTRKVGKWFDNNGNPMGEYPKYISVDTWQLRDYGMRLEKVQDRLKTLNDKLNNFGNPFEHFGRDVIDAISDTIDAFNKVFNEFQYVLTPSTYNNNGYNKSINDCDLGKCCSYIFWTCDEIERIERVLSSELENYLPND